MVVVYANPNIDPESEYERRRDTLLDYAAIVGVRVVEPPHDPSLWRAAITGLENDQPARCGACYRLRLSMTAYWAVEHGLDRFATTLTVSPHQDVESIRRAGEEIAAASGVSYVHRDFRDRYRSATARARDIGLYRQNYCGCACSKEEADETRARRRAERDAARLARDAVGERASVVRESDADV